MPQASKSCPKCNKVANLITLYTAPFRQKLGQNFQLPRASELVDIFILGKILAGYPRKKFVPVIYNFSFCFVVRFATPVNEICNHTGHSDQIRNRLKRAGIAVAVVVAAVVAAANYSCKLVVGPFKPKTSQCYLEFPTIVFYQIEQSFKSCETVHCLL